MTTDEAKRLVRERFPDADACPLEWGGTWSAIVSASWGDDRIGEGRTDAEAWHEAARRMSIAVPLGASARMIMVWRFRDAPEYLRDLSPHGGDEDVLAFLPDALADDYFRWLESPCFGSRSVSRHPIRGGVVIIGAHA